MTKEMESSLVVRLFCNAPIVKVLDFLRLNTENPIVKKFIELDRTFSNIRMTLWRLHLYQK